MQYNVTCRAVVYDDFGNIVEEKQCDFEEFYKSDLQSNFDSFLRELEDDFDVR